ncbi:MAG: hypothetical protein QM648_05575 [Solirubrobacterales bacterium]
MAANSPRKSNRPGPAPISALPLPTDDQSGDEPAAPGLPVGSTGELTPAQRARLGLDVYGDDPAPAPTPLSPPVQNGSAAQPAATDFGFAEMDPFAAQQQPQPATPEPRLAPVSDTPKLAPASPAAQPRRVEPESEEARDPAAEREARRRAEARTVSERDGIAVMENDRSVFGYGVAWTLFCIIVTAIVSLSNATANPDLGPTPGMFLPAMISIGLGWIVVLLGRSVRSWRLLMIIPAVVLVLGPFYYTSWRVDQLEEAARDYLSAAGADTQIDTDASSILSGTINTSEGCFALTKDRTSGTVRVDVVSYAPLTEQQQANFALAPRYARRVPAGGTTAVARSFTLKSGKLPVQAIQISEATIDCAGPSSGPTSATR